MSLPRGARWIYEAGRKAGARLSDGSRVSRGDAERMGARESGYRNANQERKHVADRRAFLSGNARFDEFNKRAAAHAKATGQRHDRRAAERAYWKLHVAGKNFRDARGTVHQAETQFEQQEAMREAGILTGRAPGSYPKSGDTP